MSNRIMNTIVWQLETSNPIFRGIKYNDKVYCLKSFTINDRYGDKFEFIKGESYTVNGTHYSGTISVCNINTKRTTSSQLHFSIENDHEWYFWNYFDNLKELRKRKLKEIEWNN